MTPRTKKTAVALSGALVLASGAYALGSQAGDGAALAGSTTASSAQQSGRHFGPGPGRPGGRGRELTDLAGRLGVSEAKLRAARDDREGAVAKALAGALGLSTDKVQAALEKLHGQRKLKRDDRRATAATPSRRRSPPSSASTSRRSAPASRPPGRRAPAAPTWAR